MASPRRCLAVFAVMVAVLAVPADAQTFRTVNLMQATATGPDRFVISGVPNNVPLDYWCAAGHFAQSVLRLPTTARLYVVGDRQTGQRSVTFATRPDGTDAAREEINEISVWIDGANMRVGRARAECYALFEDRFP